MKTIRLMRTTAFRLTDELLGSVYVYRASETFENAWQRATETYRRSYRAQLPYKSLATALRIISGDFVALQRRVGRDRCLIVSRQPIDRDWLHNALAVWEAVALGRGASGALSQRVDDLVEEQVPVAGLVQRRKGAPPLLQGDAWPWLAAKWEAAHRLAAEPLVTDSGSVSLRLDSEACLLTWDDRVPPNGDRHQAMHKIEPRLITLPGVEAPVLSLQSSLVRLNTRWFKPRHVWVDVGPQQPLLYADVTSRPEEGVWRTRWVDAAGELLDRLSLTPLPSLDAEPTLDGRLRTGFSVQSSYSAIGKGVGQVFHEAVAHHAHNLLPQARPVVLQRSGPASFPRRDRLAPQVVREVLASAEGSVVPHIWVVYATSAARKRFREVLPEFLKQQFGGAVAENIDEFEYRLQDLEDGQSLRLGGFEFGFFSPLQAKSHLLATNDLSTLRDWLQSWFPEKIATGGQQTALLLETLPAIERDGIGRERDPKHLLRRLLAECGAVTQFFTSDSLTSGEKARRKNGLLSEEGEEGKDYAAQNAITDLLRSAGCFLRRVPAQGVEPGTLLVGIYSKAELQGRGKQEFFCSLVAIAAGSTEAYGYVPKQGWLPLGQATAAYLLTSLLPSKEEAKAEVEKAISQLRVRHPGRKMVLYFDAIGCRRHWRCLADNGSGQGESWMTVDSTAVVRVRAETDELPRVAGQHDWCEERVPAQSTPFRPMSVADAEGSTATYLVSGSAAMSTTREPRGVSRFAASDYGLKQDWHSLNSTEFLVLDAGEWEEPAIIRQSLALCRGAPTWERVLRWPAPLHLARAIVKDHPRAGSEEDNDMN